MSNAEFPTGKPFQLPILPLHPNQIIFPKQTITSLYHSASPAWSLLQAVSNSFHSTTQSTSPELILGCVPLKSNTHKTSGSHPQQIRFQILRFSQDSANSSPSSAQVSILAPDTRKSEDGFLSDHNPYDLLYQWGCSAKIMNITPSSDASHSGYLVNLVGLRRFRIDRLVQDDAPFCSARITYFDDRPFLISNPEQKIEVDRIIESFKTTSIAFINVLRAHQSPDNDLDDKKKRMSRLLNQVTASQLPRLIDVMVSSIRQGPLDDRLAFLSYSEAEVKVNKMIELLNILVQQLNGSATLPKLIKQDNQSSDLIRFIESSKHLTPNQKQWLLQRRLTDLQRELDEVKNSTKDQGSEIRSVIRPRNSSISRPQTNGPRFIIHRGNSSGGQFPFRIMGGNPHNHSTDNDPVEDEFKQLEDKIMISGMLEEAQGICLKELKRLRVIPMASVEHSIIKNYLEIMLELPWTKSSLQDANMDVLLGKGFLQKAKDQLNEDHHGMDHVKTRLIEFLAVIKRRADLDRNDHSSNNSSESAKLGLAPSSTKDVGLADHDIMSQYANDLLSLGGDSTNFNTESSPELKSIASTNSQSAEKSSQKLVKSHTKQKAPILLLFGPPGVGKTSIAKSIAKTLNKKFYRISLGGVKDESEIRGHRRTYVGSMPGVIVQALRRVGVNDPVILLDEIDKVGSNNFHGDPSAALLEVLDPEQNTSFVDHYINTPIDLSTVLFIATANSLETISAPLLDRMETIKLNGYLFNEKMMIASRNLIPKQMKHYNLTSKEFGLENQDVLSKVILNYTRESGVRSLEREIGNLCRSKVMEFVEYQESHEESLAGNANESLTAKAFDPRIHLDDLERILGPEKYEIEMTEVQLRPGVAIGMAYQGSGNGSILFIEAQTYSGKGEMKLTGSLGDVIKESAELAISWIKNHAWELNLVGSVNHTSLLDQLDLHIHFPSGSIPKDGPSAGVALVVCLVSLFGEISLDSKLAMTGEISLRGQVLPVGGIREKVLAAHRAGIKRIIMPSRNRKDVEGDEQVKILKRDIEFNFVSNLEEVIMIVFGEKLWEKRIGEGKGKGEDVEERKLRFQKCLGSIDSLL